MQEGNAGVEGMEIRTYQGNYGGEGYLAVTDPAGNLHIQSDGKRSKARQTSHNLCTDCTRDHRGA